MKTWSREHLHLAQVCYHVRELLRGLANRTEDEQAQRVLAQSAGR